MQDILSTRSGRISGESLTNGIRVFRGIPYARPPVGDLRWGAPRKPQCWSDIRDCTQFGPTPPQPNYPESPLPLDDEPQDEDCLYLNIWTPAASSAAKLPVIIWFHPGAYQMGSGSQRLWQGHAWACEGVVFVTFNHRLGRVGFLALGSLCREDEAKLSGNYGLMDHIAVLRWVQSNIEAFGGDPDCVTIFGVSSGASSVSLLMTAPSANGLFHRAIAESGGSFGPIGKSAGIGDVWQSLQSAVDTGNAWARRQGAPDMAAMRRTRTELLAQSPQGHGLFDAARPIIDGVLLPETPYQCFANGRQAKIPLLTGSAANETMILAQEPSNGDRIAAARSLFGKEAERYLELYPASRPTDAASADQIASGDRLFTWQNHVMARLHARAGYPTYYYRFDQCPPADDRRSLGAFHACSIFYAFASFNLRPHWGWSAGDERCAAILRRSWTAFARSGNPNCEALAEWPRFDLQAPCRMHFSAKPQLREYRAGRRLRFWDDYYAAAHRAAAKGGSNNLSRQKRSLSPCN